MNQPLKPYLTKCRFLGLAVFLPLVWLLSTCSLSRENSTGSRPTQDTHSIRQVFEDVQIIGEGTEFLTLKCDIPPALLSDRRLYALIIDEDGFPLSKISGYTYNPGLKGKNHIWFFFFLYDPRETPPYPKESKYVEFIVEKAGDREMERIVNLQKTWRAKEQNTIYDLPSPPDQIPGYLMLGDYTFLAQGDLRKPQGLYAEGKIVGQKGRWTHFVPLSDIKGDEELAPVPALAADQDWLELTTGAAHSMKEAVSPEEPYVEGFWDGKGYFHARPVKIHGL